MRRAKALDVNINRTDLDKQAWNVRFSCALTFVVLH